LLRSLAQAIVQPIDASLEQGSAHWWQRAGRLLRISLRLLPLAVLLVVLARVALPTNLLAMEGETQLAHQARWLVPLLGVTVGLALGLLFGAIWGISFGSIVGLTASVVFGLPGIYGLLHTDVLGAWLVPAIGLAAGAALALSFGPAWGIAFAVIVGLAAGVGIAGPDLLADFVIGLGFSRALSVRGGLVARLEISLILGIVLGVIGGLTTGLQGGLAAALAAGLGSMLGLYRRLPARDDASGRTVRPAC
jgi:hypothetical protein